MEIKFNSVDYIINKHKKIIDNLDFIIKEKEITSIIGPNGSGKTTIAKLLSLFIAPTNGEIIINDIKITNKINKENLKKLKSQIGLVYQNPEEQFFLNTVKEEIELLLRRLKL